MTRKSTPKWEVVHRDGAVVISGISKTKATQIARSMGKNLRARPVMKRALPVRFTC